MAAFICSRQITWGSVAGSAAGPGCAGRAAPSSWASWPLDLTDPDTAAALAAFRGDEAAPAPEDEEEQPAPVEDDADEQHTTPDTVETGQSTGWWLAGLGAAAAGVQVAARRRLGLTD